MQKPYADKEIWFLTGSQDLYGPETLEQVAEQSQQVVALLNDNPQIPAPIVWRPVLKDASAIRAEIAAANAAGKVIGVIAWMHTFSPAKMWITGMSQLQKPLLQFNTQANVELPWAQIDFDFMNLNQAAHGDREFGYLTSRLSVPRKVVAGHASSGAVGQKIENWIRAAAGFDALRNLKLTRFGDNMRNVAVTEGDKTEAELAFGVSVNTWGVNDLVAAVARVRPEQVDELVAEYDSLYDVVPELRADGARRESLRYAAAQEIALRELLEEQGAKAFTTNFEDLGELKQLPGLAVQRLQAQGYGFGAEGDWKTAVLVRAAHVMGAGRPGGATLMEDYTYDLTPGAERILGSHMLEVAPTITTAKPSLEIHPLGIGGKEDPVRLVFDADPAAAVVVSLADLRDRFRLTANVVEVVAPPHPLPNLPVARALWVPAPDFATSAEAWILAGGAHHTVMTTNVQLDIWRDLAEMAAVELAVIDEQTTIPAFRDALRWSAAFHRLNSLLPGV